MISKRFIYIILIFITPISYGIEPDSAFNRLFRQDIGGWIAADATYSIFLPDGRTLWLFGDTFIGEVNEEDSSIRSGSKFIRNSAVIQDGEELITLYGGTESEPQDFIPTEHPDSTWYWPEHGIVENDTLRIFVAKFRKKSDGPTGFNFEHAGNDISSFTYPELEFIHSEAILASEKNRVLYGNRLLEDSGYIYIYGRRNDDPEINIPYPHTARVPKGELMQQEWEFFNGITWSDDPLATKRINSFQVSQQYCVSKHKEKYILITQDIWFSPKIFSFTSDSPTGPWGSKRLIYQTPETGGSTWTYNAYAHPQFDEDGRLLLSYNVNGDFWSIFSNVELYRPRFIRVPYMNLDYAFWPTTDSGEGIKKETLKAWPNPFNRKLTLSVNAASQSSTIIEIWDIQGNLIKSFEKELLPGNNDYEIDMSNLPAGMYFCRLLMMNGSQTIHLLKSTTNLESH